MILCCVLFLSGITSILVIAKSNDTIEENTMENLEGIIYSCDHINSIYNGNRTTIEKSEILPIWEDTLEGHHEMPAYSVALNSDTKEAMRLGLWLELSFTTLQTYNEMPFDKLLIEIQPDWSGFNIIRHHDGIYEGRCYYISLNNQTLHSLYDYLLSTHNE